MFKNYVASKMTYKSCSKGDIFIESGDFCDSFYFLTQELVRASFDCDNLQIAAWVCAENSLVTSVYGFFSKSPALENIQCLEHCEFECLKFEDLNYAIANFSKINAVHRKMGEAYYTNSEKRSYMARVPNAKDRYKFFLQTNSPELVERLPKKYLASLLSTRSETITYIS